MTPAVEATPNEAHRSFYQEHVPKQFNAQWEAARLLADQDPDAARVLDEMRAVRTAIRVDVQEDSICETHWLEIERGTMQAGRRGDRPPFLILSHARSDFAALRAGCGDSVLGFLGALAGLGREMKLTAQRVRSLRALGGSLDFAVHGDQGFALCATFGLEAPEDTPRAAIRIEPEVFALLRSGELDAQTAFFEERIEVDGDLEMAIGVALAVLAPD